ncbi:PREDICTED: solute carrier family 2, facilitated glucose transporter member 11-like isoform X3 [Crocodylus porosus]|uniref:solute carrier family 2, facilitated glucose transporter member 11-like isoform X3 n=1 Tax=Crocodylus porosus TaxID=8502 RepID=UPI00093B676A|nr:PREDICTED: solute carrier family 2, facilitated glucose transporter member 11-like isoform X3 [Crocodylus porosus]
MDGEEEDDELERSREGLLGQVQSRVLILTVCAAGIGGTFQYGYNISIINAPTTYIQTFMNETWLERTGAPLENNMILLLWSFIVSVYPLGGLTGALVAGPMAIKLGRKTSLLVNNVFVIIAAILSGFSQMAKSFEMIMLSRFFTGINAGVSMNIQPMYLGESAPKKIRGAVALTSASFTALGLVLGQVFGISELLGGEESWPLLLASNVVPALIQMVTLPWLPESPRYLLIDRGDKESCISALRKLRGSDDLSSEIEEILAEQAAIKGQRAKKPWELFQNPAVRWQLISIIVLSSAMQLCGNDSMYFYAGYVFREAGIPYDKIQYVIIGTGCCELITAVTCSQISWMPYLSMVCIFAYILSFGIGPAGVTGILPTEIFDQMSRPAAYMICGSLLWFNLFLTGMAFPFIVEGLAHFCYLPFFMVCVCTALYVGFFLPETKGKSFLEISEEFSKHNFKTQTHENLWKGPEEIKSTML